MKSPPSRPSGIACACIVVGVSYPLSLIDFNISGDKFKSSNFKLFIYYSFQLSDILYPFNFTFSVFNKIIIYHSKVIISKISPVA